jgi:2'-5' RNA ligase
MQTGRYALVAYLKSPAGEFVENLRRELHPDLPHMAAHLTILPPRPLRGSENSALQVLERICGEEGPFEVSLGPVETFIPVTPTVFIRIDGAAPHMSELHRKLNTGELQFKEEWPYIPHLTIVKMGSEAPAQAAFEIARQRWQDYSGSRRILMERLTQLLGRSGSGPTRSSPGFAIEFRDRVLSFTCPGYSRRAYMALGTSHSRALKTPLRPCR